MTALRDARVLITGASSGLGAATARQAARSGATVLLLARRQGVLEGVAEAIRAAGGQAHTYPVDLTDHQAVAAAANRIQVDIGVPDVIVNNAGAGRWKYVDETEPTEAMAMMAAPYFAAFHVTWAFLPNMLARNRGHLVHVTSVASHFAWPGATGYTAARWAVRGFHEALSADLAGTGVRTTLATFAKVDSPYFSNNPGSEQRIPKAQSMIRVLTPDEAARAILDGIRRNRRHVIAPFELRLILWHTTLFPSVTRWVMQRTGHRR